MRIRLWLPRCVAVLALCLISHAACAVTYVVLSLIGDQYTIAGPRAGNENSTDGNAHQVERLSDPALDVAASKFVDAAIARAQPSASVVTLRAEEPTLNELRDKPLDADPAA